MDYNLKAKTFSKLSDKYVEILEKLIDYANIKRILPLKVSIGIPLIKKYMIDNRVLLIQYGVEHLLNNKDLILNSNFEDYDDFESDNQSVKSCVSNISKVKQVLNVIELTEDFVLEIIIQIKNNSKNLSQMDKTIIYEYVKILLVILSNIRDIFYT